MLIGVTELVASPDDDARALAAAIAAAYVGCKFAHVDVFRLVVIVAADPTKPPPVVLFVRMYVSFANVALILILLHT